MTNMTYAKALDYALEVLGSEEVVARGSEDHGEVIERLEALKAQLAKRGSSKSPTKTQKENEVIMEKILESLEGIGEAVTVTDLIAYGIGEYELTNQKVSALLRKLVERGRVTKVIEGKKAKFSIA